MKEFNAEEMAEFGRAAGSWAPLPTMRIGGKP
jgi:hypothetical protein